MGRRHLAALCRYPRVCSGDGPGRGEGGGRPDVPGRRRRAAVQPSTEDRAAIVVLSSDNDTVESVLECGRALSQLLLECTVEAMATCTLTHVTETPSVRAMVSDLLGLDYPQVLVRIGQATAPPPPRTPRLPLESVFDRPGPGDGRSSAAAT